MGRKLSDLLQTSIDLNRIDFNSVSKKLKNYLSEVNLCLAELPYVNTNETKELAQEIETLLNKHRDNVLAINKHIKKIVYHDVDQYIKSSEDIWKENSEKMLFHEHVEWSKLLPPKKEEFTSFSAKILNYANWQYPGLIYGAKNFDILETVKSNEPLYLIENYKEYFNIQKEKFHIDFARKLKCYSIEDINFLPKNDIGIIVAFNEFPFLPWSSIQFILQKFIDCLMPGGILIFNYNDCTTVRGFKAFEDRIMTYATPQMYLGFLHKQNFSLLEHYVSSKETFSYMIFQKDGNRKLIKKYPSVGFIKQQPTFTEESLHHKKRLEIIRKLSNDE
jgi:hypothetical protein